MNKIIQKLILSGITIVALFGFTSNVLATNPPLSVTFIPNPLFNKINFLPLDETSGTVIVTNSGTASQIILTEAINILDNNNFGSLLHLTIKEGSVILFNNTLANFFTSGEVSLGTISNGTPRTFTYTISFIDSSDNSYQGKTLGFDVCVGFEGGNTHCGNTVIGGENGSTTPGGGGTISGSGGGGSIPITLVIFNVQALNITNVGSSGSATITWNTNLLATSQVVYGLASGGPYTLALIPPSFGYPFYTGEDGTKVINHSMLLTGLTPGQTYLYRVVSRASPPTVSPEYQFTVPLLAQAGNPNPGLVLGASVGGNGSTLGGGVTNGGTPGSGSVLGYATLNTEGISNSNGNVAAVSAFSWSSLLSTCNLISLLILLVLYLIWRLLFGRKYERSIMPEEEIWSRATLFFGGFSFLAILIIVIFHYYCPIPIFVVLFIISVFLYAYLKLKVK